MFSESTGSVVVTLFKRNFPDSILTLVKGIFGTNPRFFSSYAFSLLSSSMLNPLPSKVLELVFKLAKSGSRHVDILKLLFCAALSKAIYMDILSPNLTYPFFIVILLFDIVRFTGNIEFSSLSFTLSMF